MFTIMQTMLASLYDDRLTVSFEGRQEGDEETADNLNYMAEFDYDEMGKSKLDYEWDWDTCFYGWGLMEMEEFVREPDDNVFVPLPNTIDPLIFRRDPKATSVNGGKSGKGAMRFGGYEIRMSKQDMLDHSHFFKNEDGDDLEVGLKNISFEGPFKSPIKRAQESRDIAQNRQNQKASANEGSLGNNAMYTVNVWYTNHKGEGDSRPEKYKVWLVNEHSKVVGIKKIKRKVGTRIVWPLVKRDLFKSSHDWDGTSIPDLTEDKQRARAVAQNLGLKMLKADLYPMYVYDQNKIKNRNDLNFDFNKFVPADVKEGGSVAGSILPINKASPNLGLLGFIYESIDASAQKATATPDIQQGIQSGKDRPLGETNLISAKVDTRYSLSAKVFGWSEQEFWAHWYAMYDENFAEDIDEKILRIVGAYGATWRPVKHGNIIAEVAPDIKIESKVISRARQLEERNSLAQFYNLAFSDPTANRRYGLKHLGTKFGLAKDQIERLLPPTIDERIAEAQNESLNEGKLVPILPEDDHNVHLEIHSKAKDTDATFAHVEAHKLALSRKKTNPEQFPLDPAAANFQDGQPNAGGAPDGVLGIAPIRPSQTSGGPAVG